MVHIVKNSYEIPLLNSVLSPGFMDKMHKDMIQNFALIPVAFIEYGQYWRLLTYLFLHAHITHMIFNIVGLIWFGRICENIFGTSRFVAIYIVGGILSGVAHSFLSPHLAVGASGAVMAVFGAVAVGILRLKNKIPVSIWKFKLGLLGGLAMFQIILDQLIPHVAVFAHLGGLLGGLAFGAVLSIRSPNTDRHEITGRYVSA
jgi:membrane associated rhomboid family serine protease